MSKLTKEEARNVTRLFTDEDHPFINRILDAAERGETCDISTENSESEDSLLCALFEQQNHFMLLAHVVEVLSDESLTLELEFTPTFNGVKLKKHPNKAVSHAKT